MVKKFFKLFSVSRGILFILELRAPAISQWTLLSHRKNHRQITAVISGFPLLGARVWIVKRDKVTNLFCEIRTNQVWLTLQGCYKCAGGPWEYLEIEQPTLFLELGRVFQSVGHGPHIRITCKLAKGLVPEPHP